MNAHAKQTTAYQNNVSYYQISDTSVSSRSLASSRVRVSEARSSWAKELKERFDELTSLEKGWDGYTGVPVSFTCAQFAANLIESLYVQGIPAPQLVPGSDGTVQLEWHKNGYDLEIDIIAPFEVFARLYDHSSDDEQEIMVEADFTKLAEWVRKLSKITITAL